MWLDFDANPYALSSLLTSLLVIGLIGYIVRQRYQTITLRWLVATLIVILVWSTAEFFIRISANPETARFFKYWEIAGYVALGPTALGLCLAYVGKDRSLQRWKWLAALFVPAILFVFAAWTQNLFVNLQDLALWHRTWYGEWAAPLSKVFTYAYVPWLNILLLIALLHLVHYYRQQHDPVRRRGVLIFVLGVAVPSVVALITDQLWQVVTGVEMLELATLTLGISGVWITYGIIKYQLFEVNPAVIATNILETMNEVVVVCNPELVIEYVSQPVKGLLGYENFSMVGQPLNKYVADGWSKIQEIAELNAKGDKSVEVQLLTQDKKSVPTSVSTTAYATDGNEVLAFVFVLVDLRQVQELLNTTQERDKLQATLSSMTDGIVGITDKGLIGLVNQSFCAMLGVQASDLYGKSLIDAIEIREPESDSSIAEKLLEEVDDKEFKRQDLAVKLVSNSSKVEVDAELKVTKLPDQHDVELIAIIAVHNVTEERQLKQMKSDFTALAAHELRTPLTAIRGYVRVLQDESKTILPPDQIEVLDRLESSSKRLNDLVNRLLEVSAIEQGKFKVELASVDLLPVVSQVVERYQSRAKQEGWVFESSLPVGELLVKIDRERIEQVLEILLDNAVKYSNDSPRVGLIMRADDNQIVLSIIDNGPGILPELQKSLFEPYSRRTAGLRQTNQGAGLSLHIAKSIVELHGGEISVESSVDKGSTFTIILPR